MIGVQTQLILFWAAVGFCFLATFFYISSLSFAKEGYVRYGTYCSYTAFLPMLAALILRWLETGHVPSIGPYEVFTIYAWGVLLFFLVAQWWKPNAQIAGIFVLPVVMLMIGVGVMSSTELTALPNTYYTYWLWIHMLFATLALGGVLTSAGLALIYLVKSHQEEQGAVSPLLTRLPGLEQLDFLCYRFTHFAFSMMGIMIASGAIWAYKSWGRYWGWDPIETWSLICWLVYGLYLHLRKSGLRGKKAAYVYFAVIGVAIFCFFGAPYLYPTIHDRFVR
ncbi:MAG TPA: cytochrome c biogenesis protein CcsA [Bacillota bacterium]|nr:cytochrome c biogenesis protein CcsA [Bacillota bacterium]